MTHEEYLATPKRESDAVAQTSAAELFACYRIRSGVSTRFLPGQGATLHFANKATDTLRLPSIPQGFLVSGDTVKVYYKGVCVFSGDVDSRRRRKSKGSDDTEEITITGPWAKMARLVYRQNWNTASGYQLSSRLILNQHQSGTAQNINSELTEIANHKATACGYSVGSINVSTITLPLDECRDITIADAIRRELRLFPKVISRFDYSGQTPALYITRPSTATDAAYIASIPKQERNYEYNAHPITGVDLEIETTGDVQGVTYRDISHQTAGNTLAGNPNCLYATLTLAGASSNSVSQSLKSVTEAIPSDLSDKTWWMSKHPRLANYSASQVTITDGARSGAQTAANYPRIAAASAGELEEAGLNARVERFSCKATIVTSDDKEEEIYLTMDFLTTNATTRTYTWIAESSSSSGETVPSGLAAAILADRAGDLRSESMTIRLGDTFPQLGDAADGLLLQSFDVDLGELTASLEFGVPDYLTPEDMASLLSGFRNKRTSSSHTVRSTGVKADKASSKVELGSIMPLNATEFSPGVKAKQTFKSVSDTSANSIVIDATGHGGNINLSTGDVPSGDTVAVKTLTIKGAGTNGADLIISIVASQDATIPQGGASLDKEFSVDGSKVADIAASANIDITQKTISAGSGISVTGSSGVITIALANSSGGTSGFSGERTVIGGVRYVTSSHTLQYKPIAETWVNGVLTSSSEGSWTTFHTAVEETY
ncbi:MAG: hypothetical protein IJQ34_07370 [Kiritimatiellae bacterium]|nr:hypothetical protein [Kiritimatiellia bacterium]